MDYNTDEKMSAIASILYTEFNDVIEVKYNEYIIIKDKNNDKTNQRIFDKVIMKVKEIHEKESICIVYRYIEKSDADYNMEIAVVDDYSNYTYDDGSWYKIDDI